MAIAEQTQAIDWEHASWEDGCAEVKQFTDRLGAPTDVARELLYGGQAVLTFTIDRDKTPSRHGEARAIFWQSSEVTIRDAQVCLSNPWTSRNPSIYQLPQRTLAAPSPL